MSHHSQNLCYHKTTYHSLYWLSVSVVEEWKETEGRACCTKSQNDSIHEGPGQTEQEVGWRGICEENQKVGREDRRPAQTDC